MNNIEKVKRGLEIILSYENDGCLEAGHDVIYAGDSRELSEEHIGEMETLGWRWDSHNGCWGKFV